MKERMKRILPWIGYPLFYLLAFVLFAIVTFPFDKLKEHLVVTFNDGQRQTGGHDQLSIGEMSGYWLTGVKLRDITFVLGSADPKKPPAEIKVAEARASIALLPLLAGNKDVSFHASVFDGEISGSYEMHGKDRAIDLDLEGLDLGQLEPLTQLLGLPFEGKLSGTVKLSMPEGRASKGGGEVNLEASDVAIGDNKAKIKVGFGELTFPRTVIGNLSFAAEAKEGVLKLTKFSATGRDIDIDGDGRITMRDLATESLMDVILRIKFSDGYKDKSDMTRALFGAPGGKGMPPLLEQEPKVKQAKRADGSYGWVLRGQLGRPDFIPSAGGPIGPQAPVGPSGPKH